MGFPEQQRTFLAGQMIATPILPAAAMEGLINKPKLHRRMLEQVYLPDPKRPFTFTPCPILMPEGWVDSYLYYPNTGYPQSMLGVESHLFWWNCSAKLGRVVLRAFKHQYRQLVREFDVAVFQVASYRRNNRPEDSFASYVTWQDGGPVMQRRDLQLGEFFNATTRYLVCFSRDPDFTSKE